MVERTYQLCLEKKETLPVPEDFTWLIWNNQASPGILEIYPATSKDLKLFKKDKSELFIQYLDVFVEQQE